MSLINKALKLEQQRRQTSQAPVAPMVAHLSNRGRRGNLSMLLIGFTGMGMLLAASITAIFYFGNGYLEQNEGNLAAGPATEKPVLASKTKSPPTQKSAKQAEEPGKLENLIGNLSQEQLSTVQKMLVEKAEKEKRQAPAPTVTPQTETPAPTVLSKVTQIQDIVDSYSIQGIRKAGKDTRVFLNGKIRRIGDIIELEHDLRLIGFTEDDLVFRTPDGRTYKKSI